MEQHPIPQNVTTFQFRLIGDMTIKQFGFLALGAALAYVCYKLPLPSIITLPLAGFFGLLGIGLAFVPIEERPMDVWIMSFIKSIYSPTLYVWQKSAQKPTPSPSQADVNPQKHLPRQTGAIPGLEQVMAASNSITSLLTGTKGKAPDSGVQKTLAKTVNQPTTMFTPMSSPLRTASHSIAQRAPLPLSHPQTSHNSRGEFALQASSGLLQLLQNLFHKSTPPSVPRPSDAGHGTIPVASPMPAEEIKTEARNQVVHRQSIQTPLVPSQSDDLKKAQIQSEALTATVSRLEKELESKSVSESHVLELQKQLAEATNQRERLERELAALRRTVFQKSTTPPVYAPPTTVATDRTPTVRIVTPESAPKVGLPRLTTFPNVVTGLVKDSDGSLLPGVLVTVRDKDNVPQRALKSNKIGQFASAVPLPNGVYMVEVEDPRERFLFDRAQITLTGAVLPAIEIIAKSQKQVARAKLEKEIFSTQM